MEIHELKDGEQVKKYHVALLYNKGTKENPEWGQISKSTDNTITMNAETVDRDFIVDTSPTTIVDRYKPSLNEPITLFKGAADYKFFWNKFYNLATGDKAQGEIMIVFMNESEEELSDEEPKTVFKAWRSNCAFVCDSFNPIASTLTFNINFNGTVRKGTVEIDEDGNLTFTEE